VIVTKTPAAATQTRAFDDARGRSGKREGEGESEAENGKEAMAKLREKNEG
jgi:hypothetical protein